MKTSWTGQPVLSFVKEGGPFAKKKGRYLLALLALVCLTVCVGGEKKSDKPLIYTSFSPNARHDQYGNLYFKSYYWANQIFNLNKY